jgi:hypothetical protein
MTPGETAGLARAAFIIPHTRRKDLRASWPGETTTSSGCGLGEGAT